MLTDHLPSQSFAKWSRPGNSIKPKQALHPSECNIRLQNLKQNNQIETADLDQLRLNLRQHRFRFTRSIIAGVPSKAQTIALEAWNKVDV